uniref:Uncharacterized protein n=1 Tax=Ananas comosus var. bracteatus TaxID=296719 RepID=A0A6V7NY34_ANACO|nr:unnamed protein product [Ananas comosus var. bracteatus]
MQEFQLTNERFLVPEMLFHPADLGSIREHKTVGISSWWIAVNITDWRLLALGGQEKCCPFGVCSTRPNRTKLVAVSGRDTLFSNKPPAYLLQCPHTVDSRPVYPKREATYAPISSDQSPSP